MVLVKSMQYLSIITLKIYRKLNKKLKVQFLIIFLLIFSSFIKSSPYLEIEKESILELEFFSTQCEFNLNYTNFYPFPYVEILNLLESYKNKYSASDECRQRASLLHKKIFEEFFSSSSYISISSKRPDLFFKIYHLEFLAMKHFTLSIPLQKIIFHIDYELKKQKIIKMTR